MNNALKLSLLSLVSLAPLCQAATPLLLEQLPSSYSISYEQVKMPNGDPNMGLAGWDYKVYVTPWFFIGPKAYGAVNGDAGGLFTLGMVTGVEHVIKGPFFATASVFAGGGGGRSSDVGGGAMIQPEVGILYKPSKVWGLGVNYSYVTFPSGDIHSSQLGLSLLLTSDWLFADPAYAGYRFTDLDRVDFKGADHLAWSHDYLSLIEQTYVPMNNSKDRTGASQTDAMSLLGFEVGHYFDERRFVWVRSSGALHGAPSNGYMDVLGGVGYRYPLGTTKVSLLGEMGVGAGGGGDVDTGGGFLVEPGLGLQYDFTEQLASRLTASYLDAPNGNFSATALTVNLLYQLDFATRETGVLSQAQSMEVEDYAFHGWQAIVLNQTYVRPQRSSSDTTSSANLFALQLNQLLSPHFYLAYQGSGAYQGDHVGGLATGLIGAGVQTAMSEPTGWQASAEFLAGAGGGGGLALGGGAIIEPNIGTSYHFNRYFSATLGVGEVIALNDSLNTPIVNAGIRYDFATLN